MKKCIIALLAVLSVNANAADCPADLKPLCDAAAGLKKHEGIYLQINPTKNVRFEQASFKNFVSVNDRGELAENYGTDGEVAREAVRQNVEGIQKLASHKREPVYVVVTSNGQVLKGNEIDALNNKVERK